MLACGGTFRSRSAQTATTSFGSGTGMQMPATKKFLAELLRRDGYYGYLSHLTKISANWRSSGECHITEFFESWGFRLVSKLQSVFRC